MNPEKQVTADGEVISICLTENDIVYTGNDCGLICKWNTDLDLKDSIQLGDCVSCISILPDGRLVVCCDCKVLLLSADLKLQNTVLCHDEEVNCIKCQVVGEPQKILLASCDDDGFVVISSLATGKLKGSKAGHNNIVTAVVWDDNNEAMTSESGATLILYSSGLDCKVVQWLVFPNSGELTVCRSIDCNTVVADPPTGAQYRVAPPMLHSLVLLNGMLLAPAENGCIYVVDPSVTEDDDDSSELEHLLNVRRHAGAASCLAVTTSLIGTLVISGGDDGCIKMFSLNLTSSNDDEDVLEVGEERIIEHSEKVNALCVFKQAGKQKVIVADIQGHLSIYDLNKDY